MRPALAKAVECGPSIETAIADKAYDSETVRRYIVIELGAEAHISARNVKRTGENSQGFYRRRRPRVFDESRYRRRALVETVNSMLKRTSSIALAAIDRGQANVTTR